MRREAVRGAIWTLGARAGAVLAQFGALLLLARMLSEREFGLAWMVAVVTGVLGVGADLGMDVVAVQRREADERRAARLAEAAGWGLFGLVALLAPWIAHAFGDPPGLVVLLRMGAFSFVMAGFAAPARARLRRDLRFGRLAAVDAARALAAAGIAVTLAARGHGAGSLVLADVLAGGLAAALAWLLAPSMRAGTDRALAADGARVVGTRLADAAFAQADRFFVGSRLGTEALGIYGFAWRHAMALLQHALPVAEQVALPLFAKLQKDRDGLARAYLRLTRVLALVLVPPAALLWGIAPWLVELLYPGRWSEAVPALRALCVAAAAAGLNSDPGLLWMAAGRMRLRLLWSLANLAVLVPLLRIGATHGVVAVAYVLAARSVLATVAAQVVSRRVAGIPHGAYARALLPGVVAGALVAAAFAVA